MIVEMAVLEAKPGEADALRDGLRAARTVIERAEGYLGSAFCQSIEKPERFVLSIKWVNVAAHMEGFRQSAIFPQWRSHFAHLLSGPPDVLHYEVIAGDA